jgi:tetratricopeptide (TPR) repeat protein
MTLRSALEPVSDARHAETYTLRQVARLFALPEHRLRYWSQTGFLVPSAPRPDGAGYTFRDLVTVKVAKELLDAGLPFARVRRSIDALRVSLPREDRSLSRLRIRGDHDRVVVDDAQGTFDAMSGQRLFDFDLAGLSRDASAVVRPLAKAQATEPTSAYGWFLLGVGAEVTAPERARAAYERAVELDPELGAAWTNLGALLADAGDVPTARDCFAEALRSDPDQPEARLNLSELALRDGDLEVAIAGYRQVLVQEPHHAEAHYGLARALLEVGGKAQALAHLERFCRLREVDGTLDELERERIAAARVTMERLRREADGAP